MEVACSLEDFAKVLTQDGYINDDASYFPDANDLPSMLRVLESKTGLDSPESFPESPCSDEDIARVLEITQMSSPSLLESCIPDSFVPFPGHHTDSLDSNPSAMGKTRDPCITNAVLNDVFRSTTAFNFNARNSTSIFPPTSLDAFCLPSNVFPDSVSVNNLPNISTTKENDTLNHSLYDSTPLLSPISEIDHIINQTSPEYPEHINDINSKGILDDYHNTHQHHNLFQPLPSPVIINIEQPNTQLLLDPPTSNKKQRKKRKRKGYNTKSPKSKNSKSKKDNNSPTCTPQSKAKKAKLATETSHQPSQPQPTKKNKLNIDSQPISTTSSTVEEKAPSIPDGNTDSSNASTDCPPQTEEPKLRRSSRATKAPENYNFRLSSIVKRVETERRQKEPKKPKGKAKPPPLSKYRRRTANARERDRMKEINDAFDVLKQSLPPVEDESKNKVTKFTILKLALNYISSLRDMLGMGELKPTSESDNNGSFSGSLLPDFSLENYDDDSSENTQATSSSPTSDSSNQFENSLSDFQYSPSSVENIFSCQNGSNPMDTSPSSSSSTSSS